MYCTEINKISIYLLRARLEIKETRMKNVYCVFTFPHNVGISQYIAIIK